MRWDGLFADLEGQAEALLRAERSAEIDERTRIELGRIGIGERLRAAVGMPLRLRLAGGLVLAGTLRRAGPDWLLVAEDLVGDTGRYVTGRYVTGDVTGDVGGREAVVPLAAVVGVRGLPRFAASADTATPGSGAAAVVASRLSLRHAARGIARDRATVRVHLVDGAVVDGTIDRVGADFVELAAHAAGEVRRRHDVRETELVPLSAVAAIRRSG